MSPTPEPLTDERLAVIEARCQAATPGPWSVDGAVEWDCDGGEECRCQETSNWRDCLQPYWIRGTWLHGPEWIEDDDKSYFNEDDAAFAAAARADVPDLLAEVRRLQELVGADVPTAWTRGYYAGRLAGWDLANTGTPRSAILTGEDAEGDPPA